MFDKLKTLLTRVGIYFIIPFTIVLSILIYVIVFIVKKGKNTDSPQVVLKTIVETAKQELDRLTIQSKVNQAVAQGKEQSVIDELKRIAEEPDSRKRRERLARAL